LAKQTAKDFNFKFSINRFKMNFPMILIK
jgi:hypothetical protein